MTAKTATKDPEVISGETLLTLEELEAKTQTTTIGDLGNVLPIGIFVDGKRLREVAFKDITAGDERRLGSLMNKPKVKLASIVGPYLKNVVESIGGYSVEELAKAKNVPVERLFTSLTMGDGMALLAMLKIEASGVHVAMAGTCPNCGHENQDDPKNVRHMHEIDGCDIKVLDDTVENPPVLRVELPRGFNVFDDVGKVVRMEPLSFYHLDDFSGRTRDPLDIEMLKRVIAKIEHPHYEKHRFPLIGDVALYDTLSIKRGQNDILALREAMTALNSLMPEFAGEMVCEECTHTWEAGIEWASLRTFLFSDPTAA